MAFANGLTVANNKDVDADNSKCLADSVVGVLELSLHDGAVDLGGDDAADTEQQHPASALAPLDCLSGWLLRTSCVPIGQAGN